MGQRLARTIWMGMVVTGVLFAADGEWTSIGPEGGTILRIAVAPANPAIVYAGTSAGVFKSVDEGATWTAVNSGLPTPDSFNVVEIDPVNAGTVYTASRNGVFKTTDGGLTWRDLHSSSRLLFYLDNTNCQSVCSQALAIDPANPEILYAAASQVFNPDRSVTRGVLKSTDGGETWKLVASGRYNIVAVDRHDGTVYASSYDSDAGLFKSDDGGADWTKIAQPRFPVAGIAVDPQVGSTVYYWIGGQLFKSSDTGANWTDVTPPMPKAPPDGYNRAQAFAIDPRNPALLHISLYQTSHYTSMPDFYMVFTSSDGGTTWSASKASPLSASDALALSATPRSSTTWYVGSTNGILKTDDGGANWTFRNSGLRATPVAQAVIGRSDETLLAVREYNPYGGGLPGRGLLKSVDGGKSWVPTGSGLPVFTGPILAATSDLRPLYTFASEYPYRPNGNGLYRSDDGGETWTQAWITPQSAAGTPLDMVGSLAIDPADPQLMYATGSASCSIDCLNYTFRSTDGGRTWAPSPSSKENGSPFGVLAINPQNPSVLYGATFSWGGWTGNDLWKSFDQGAHWTNLTGIGYSYTLQVDALDPNTVYLADGDIRKSTDGGQTWNTTLRGGYDLLALSPENPATLYAARSLLIPGDPVPMMRSVDGGATWTRAAPPLSGLTSIFVDPGDPNQLYGVTRGGLFTTTIDAGRRLRRIGPERPGRPKQ